MQHYSPLRYPGGKGRLAVLVKDVIYENEIYDGTYIEPYAGGAGMALALLIEEYVWDIIINDIDPAIYAFWHTLLNQTEWLRKQIHDTPVDLDQWYIQKKIFENPHEFSLEQLGFATFFLNRTNRSGILNGGVIGGKKQESKYKIDARYNKISLDKRIELIARHRNRINLYNMDAAEFLQQIIGELKGKVLFYFDPPYYHKGGLLYTNHYTHADHEKMAEIIKDLNHPWIVTYDDVPVISQFYNAIPSLRFSTTYSANLERVKGSEIMFYQGIDLPSYVKKMKFPYFSRYRLKDLTAAE